MKKLLLFLALAAAGLQGRADDLYIVGNATAHNGYAWGGQRDPYKLNETDAETNEYSWTGFLKQGRFKICNGKETWDAYQPGTDNLEIDASGTGQTITLVAEGVADNQWKVVNPGIYVVTVSLSSNTISITPDWYDIDTADKLVEFASDVNSADATNHNAARWARLTANIDMDEKTFAGIGLDTDNKRYCGTFDGQGHKISNLTMTSAYCAFVTFAEGGCTVKNLLIDNTCEFNGGGRVAALISGCNYSNFGVPVTILNCGNEANVSGTANNCAGLLGCNYGNGIKVTIKNSFNAGNISSTGKQSAPISGWLGSNARVENTYNIGSIANSDENNSFARWDGSGSSYENCYSTLSWGNTIEGKTLGYDADNVSSGLFCYTLNGNVSGGEAWLQTLPGDTHPYPGVFTSHAKVYANGDLHCDGTAKGTVTYSNTEGENRDDHDYEDGFCSYCNALDVDYMTPVDGYYQIGTMHDLYWFSQYVNAGNPSLNAKLTADIEQESENEFGYTPIGTQSHPYIGTFDGQAHSVTLRINNSGYSYQGLFGVVTDGVFIEKVIVKGYVRGNNYVGGIVGGTNGGSSNVQETNIWYCGNEATITASGGNAAGIIGVNMSGEASVILTNCYNTGDVTGHHDSGALSGWLGGGWSSVRNCYNSGTVKNDNNSTSKAFGRNNGCYFTNCYYTATSGTDNSTEDTGNGQPSYVADAAVGSGLLCAKLGYGFRQNLGEGGDAKPNFNVEHGFVSQIGEAGYSTMYNIHSDVTIPDGVEAYAGVINGDEWLHLDPISEKVKASTPVILKLAEGTEAGLFNFMPTTGASAAESNDLLGSDGSVEGNGSSIYALANLGDPAVVGFYLVNDGVTVPAGKAYLNTDAGVKGFTFVFDDDATSINEELRMKNEESEASIFNLAGQRIQKMQRGINIVNGKKILK